MAEFEARPGGALFQRKKLKANHPDLGGELVLDMDAFNCLCEQYKANQPLKLELSGWTKTSQKGVQYLSLSAKRPWEKPGEAQPQRSPSGVTRDTSDDGFDPPF